MTASRFKILACSAALAVVAASCGSDGSSESKDTQPAVETTDGQPAVETTDGQPSGESGAPASAEFEVVEPGSGAGLKLGYISIGEAIPFAVDLTTSFKEQADIAGAELIVCDSNFDAALAIECARSLATQGVDGYMSSQLNAASSPEVCDAGPDVPVLAIAIPQDPCAVSFMGADDSYAGEIAGTAVGEFFKSNFDCAYDAFVSLESTAVGEPNTLRMQGYSDGFESVCGPITNKRVVDTAATIDDGRVKFTDVLTALSDAQRIVVVGINDDVILGALSAAEAQGREDAVFVSGQGADATSWCGIRDNAQWIADTAYFPDQWGKIAIPNLIRAVNGETLPPYLYVPHVVVTSDNIEDFYELSDC